MYSYAPSKNDEKKKGNQRNQPTKQTNQPPKDQKTQRLR